MVTSSCTMCRKIFLGSKYSEEHELTYRIVRINIFIGKNRLNLVLYF